MLRRITILFNYLGIIAGIAIYVTMPFGNFPNGGILKTIETINSGDGPTAVFITAKLSWCGSAIFAVFIVIFVLNIYCLLKMKSIK